MLMHFATGRDLCGAKLILHGCAGFWRATGEDVCIIGSDPQGAVAIRSRGAQQICFTYHILTGHIFLRFPNGLVVKLTVDKTPSSRCVLTAKMFRATTLLTVTTDPVRNRNELFRTPLRALYGHEVSWAPSDCARS